MKTTSTYGATLIDVMGSDLTVVNAARVSFDKTSEFEKVTKEGWEDDVLLGGYSYTWEAEQLKDSDTKLIAYLARHNHWTPFAHPQLSFRVSAPIFVARQLQKHQVGLAWNEVSRRYVDSEPVIYFPAGPWRKKADNVKQGSSDDTTYLWKTAVEKAMENSVSWYNALLEGDVCPEQARMVLPQSMITEWVWTGSLAAFARVVNQRLDPHAQRECRPVAEAIAKALREHFPVSWMALQAIPSEDK